MGFAFGVLEFREGFLGDSGITSRMPENIEYFNAITSARGTSARTVPGWQRDRRGV